MPKFRKKPVVIEAEQWFPGAVELSERLGVKKVKECPTGKAVDLNLGFIDTLEGGHIVSPGDWIITGVKGERYPCKDDIFKMTYEPVEEE